MHRTLHIVSAASALLFALASPVLAQVDPPATIFWTGASNSLWSVSGNWNPARVPLTSDHVEIATGTNVQLDVAASISSLRLGQSSGSSTQMLVMNLGQSLTLATNSTVNSNGVISFTSGVIGGAGALSVQGRMDWSGGILAGTLEIAPGATLNLIGPANKLIGGNSTLRNKGTITWEGTGDFGGPIGARVENFGLFEVRNDQAFFDSEFYDYGSPVFLNAGRFRKSGGTGATRFDGGNQGTLFTNVGIVQIQSGTLSLRSATALGHGGTFAGAGFTSQDAGAVTIFGTNTVVAGATVQVSTATMNGTGAFAGPGSLQWTNGSSLNGTLTLLPDATLRLASSTSSEISAGTLLNFGLVTQQGAGNFHGRNGCSIRNFGTWALGDNTAFVDSEFYDYVSPVFENLGTLRKSSGAGAVTFDGGQQGFVFTNVGLVQIDSGALRFRSSTKLGPGGTFSGVGLTSQDVVDVTFHGTNTISAGAVFQVAAAAVYGSHAIAGPGTLQWTNGSSLAGTLTVLPNATLRLASTNSSEINGGRLINLGLVTHQGAGTFNGRNGCTITNFAMWDLNDNATFLDVENYDYVSPLFVNLGTLRKSSGAGAVTFDGGNQGFVLTNASLVQIDSGSLRLRSSTKLGPGGTFAGAGFTSQDIGDITFFGTNTLSASTLFQIGPAVINGNNGAVAGPGTLQWTNGTSLSGTLTILPNAVLRLASSSSCEINGGTLVNFGSVEHSGAGSLNGRNGCLIRNLGAWALRSDAQFVDPEFYDYVSPQFENRGTLLRDVAGTNIFRPENQGFQLHNAGLAHIQSGTVAFNGGGAHTNGEFRVNAGATLEMASGQHTLRDGARLNISGLARIAGAGVTQMDTTNTILAGGHFEFSSGTLGGRSAMGGPGTVTWSGGTLAGTNTLLAGGMMNISGDATKQIAPHAWLVNAGTMRWTGNGDIAAQINSVLRNEGVFEARNDRAFVDNEFYDYGNPRFENAGTFRKVASIGTTRFGVENQGFAFVNDGVIEATAGTVRFESTFVPGGSSTVRLALGGATPGTEFGRIVHGGAMNLAGQLQVVLTNGFAPTNGQTFTVVASGSLGGGFSTTTLPALSAGLTWSVDQNLTSVVLGIENLQPCAIPPSDLVLWAPAEGHAFDVVGGSMGALHDGAGFTVGGRVGRGFQLDGASDYVSFPDSPSLRSTNLTIEGWFKLFSLAGPRILVSKSVGSGSLDSYALWIQDGNLNFALADQAGYGVITTALNPAINTWYHLAATFDDQANVMRLFTNGVLAASQTENRSIAYDSHPLLIGAEYENESLNFFTHGLIDEVSLYRRALAEGEIASIFGAGLSGKCSEGILAPTCIPPPGGLVGWWPGDDSAINLASGIPANLLNGTIYGPGVVAQAFSFDGSDDMISIGNLPALQGATELTLAAWILNEPGAANSAGILGQWDTTGNVAENSFILYRGESGFANRGAFGLQFENGSVGFVQGVSQLPVGDWVHIAATWSSSNGLMRLYKNGVLDASSTNGLGQVLRHHTVFTAKIGEWGKNNNGSITHWRGAIDEPMIFTRALGSNEITAIHAAGIAGVCRPSGSTSNATTTLTLVTDTTNWRESTTNDTSNANSTPWPGATFMPATSTYTVTPTAGAGHVYPVPGATTLFGASSVRYFRSTFILPNFDTLTAVISASFDNDLQIFINGHELALEGNLTGGNFSPPNHRLFVYTDGSVINGYEGGKEFSTRVAANFLPSFFQVGTNEVILALRNLNGGDSGGVAFRADFATTGLGTNSRPDLTVTSVNGPVSAFMGQAVPLVYSLSNTGAATAFGPWVNHIVIATNAAGAGAQTIGSANFLGEIPLGSSVTLTQAVILPAGVFGPRFLGVIVDGGGTVNEPNETNNTRFATLAITIDAADLVGGNLNAPASARFGQEIIVTYAVTNIGTATASAVGNDQIFLSATSNSIAGATLLATVPGASLNVGTDYPRTQPVQAPLINGLAAGTYFIVIAADAGNAQPESREDNNLVSRAITLSYPPLSDLAVDNVIAPQFILAAGEPIIFWTVTNRGTLGLTNVWSETVSISNAVLGVQSLAEFSYTNFLALGQSLTRTQTVVLPADLSAGHWQFLVTTDSRGDVFESNESNNITVATNSSEVPAELTLSLPVVELWEGAPDVLATVTRNGDRTLPLTVAVTNSDPTELAVTNSVVIPAGQSAVSFPVRPLLDGVVDGSQYVTLGVMETNYRGATASLNVHDIDVPRLTLLLSATNLVEGLVMSATISRDYATNRDLTVVLFADDPAQLAVPISIVISSNQLSGTFSIMAVEDTLIETTKTNLVVALAGGFQSATGSVTILDNDLPNVAVVIVADSVSEGAGSQATSATVTRSPVTTRPLTVQLTSTLPASAVVPATVTIPGGEASVSFPIAAVDNAIVDGNRTVMVRVFVRDSFGNLITEGTPDTLQILDDDGPTLKLIIARDLVAEGQNPAATATITRNTATNVALIVTIISSDTTELTLSGTVIIPAGETAATVNLITPLDGTTDGNQSVTVTASANGFTSGSDVIVVSDIDLPDLAVAHVSAPTNGVTDGNFTLSYRVENLGIAASTANFTTRVWLSTDTFLENDTLLGDFPFAGTLPVGLFIEQTSQFQLPTTPGRYWVIIEADAGGQVVEGLENNNSFVTALPIEVKAAYTATVETSVTTALAGTSVPLSGSAMRAGTGLPAANVPLNVHLLLRGTRRVFSAMTDGNGNFTTTFTPLPGEAGLYEIGAAHPGATEAPVQDTFTLFGLKLQSLTQVLKVTEGGSITGALAVINLGETPLSDLAASVVSAPANLSAVLTLASNALPALGSNQLTFVITANSATPSFGELHLRVTSASGASSDAILQVAVESLEPRLVAAPENLYAAMIRGGQATVEFDVVNAGGAASEPIVVSVPNAPWLRVGSANPLPALAPGQTNHITLLLTPASDLPLGPYAGSISLNAGDASLGLPFTFRAVADLKGDLLVEAVDEFTYYAADAPKVTNATVTVRDAFTHETITNRTTDAQGRALFPQLTEGYYEVEVTAEKHSQFLGTTFVKGGRTNEFETFLSRETVRYRWTVVPTLIEDRTRIVIETLFETFVPAPVVTIEPALIDLQDFTGSQTQINLTIRNHGLVAAQEFTLNFPEHPGFTFTPLVTEIGALGAETFIVVPLMITRDGGSGLRPNGAKGNGGGGQARGPTSGGACSVSGGGCWTLPCGKRKNAYCASVSIVNLGCPPSVSIPGIGGGGAIYAPPPPPPNGPGGGFATGGGNGGAGGLYTFPRSFEPPNICDCDKDNFEEKCKELPLSSSVINAGVQALATALSTIPNLKVTAKTDAKVSGCVCCDDDGMGLKVSGGGSVTFEGMVSVPFAGAAFQKTFQSGVYSIEANFQLGCTYEQGINLVGSVSGGTKCHLKDLEVCGELSVDLPASIPCKAEVKLVAKQNGVVKGEKTVSVGASLNYGLSGSVKYCKNANGSTTSGEICGKGLTFKAGVDIQFAELGINFNPEFEHELAPGDCYQFGFGSRAGLAMKQAAEAEYESKKKEMRAIGAARTLAKAAAAGTAGPIEASEAADEGGVCAKVRLQINQDVVLTRNAFNATLELVNSSPSALTDVSVTLFVVNEQGSPVDERFGFRAPVIAGISGVDGTGVLSGDATGTVTYIIVPTSKAAPDAPIRYGVGGILSYKQDGQEVVIPLYPAPITVYPDPRLAVKYFHERDVFADDPFTRDIIEPSVPFNLGVLVQNRGGGIARNVRIVSGQPQIIENEKGLLIDFRIIGTEVAGQAQTPSLTAMFGEIPPGTNAIARWLLTSTLQGLFLDYEATFEHQDSLGKTNLSLIESVTIHEMNHLVQAPGALDDGRVDFLVNDAPDAEDLPDTIHLSDGTTAAVQTVLTANHDGPPSDGDLMVQVTASMPVGWAYLRVPDPADGSFRLTRVARSDGVDIYFGTNVWTTDRTFIGRGKRPINEHRLHLLDYNSTGSYTLHYTLPPPNDTVAPSSLVLALPANNYPQFPIHWSGMDGLDGSGVSSFDILVSIDGGPFAPWLQATPLNSSVYQGESGHTYAFYSIAVDAKGNREGAPLSADTQTLTTLNNSAPTITLPANVTLNEGQTLSLTALADDVDEGQTLTFGLLSGAPAGVALNSINGQITWPTGEGNGPSTNQIRVIVTDNGQPSMSATSTVSVIVNEVNSAPVLAAVSNRTINELQNLSIPLVASDGDLPAQTLTFSLGSGAPSGATLNSSNGVFSWTPTTSQGPTTNNLTVIVRDNGTPLLSATQSFTVIVRDTRADFTVSLGSTNLYAGQSGYVQMNLQSGIDLTNISLFLNLSANGLTNLTLAPIAPSVGSVTLSPSGPNRYQVRLVAGAGEVLEGIGEFARLTFATSTNLPSALVRLQPENIVGVRATGEVVPGGGFPGRVIVVNREPVLVASGFAPRQLEVFGRPGVTYDLLTSMNVTGPWLPAGSVTLVEAISSVLTLQVSGQNIFYRAVENSGAPLLEYVSAGNHIDFTIRGETGRTYTFQSSLVVTGPWANEFSLTFTNAFRSFSRTNGGEPAKFFRVRRD